MEKQSAKEMNKDLTNLKDKLANKQRDMADELQSLRSRRACVCVMMMMRVQIV